MRTSWNAPVQRFNAFRKVEAAGCSLALRSSRWSSRLWSHIILLMGKKRRWTQVPACSFSFTLNMKLASSDLNRLVNYIIWDRMLIWGICSLSVFAFVWFHSAEGWLDTGVFLYEFFIYFIQLYLELLENTATVCLEMDETTLRTPTRLNSFLFKPLYYLARRMFCCWPISQPLPKTWLLHNVVGL